MVASNCPVTCKKCVPPKAHVDLCRPCRNVDVELRYSLFGSVDERVSTTHAQFGPQTFLPLTDTGVVMGGKAVAGKPYASYLGCNAADWAGDGWKGKVALVQRGGCYFLSKVMTAQSKGAVAVVIFNSNDDPAIIMIGRCKDCKIPTVKVGKDEGQKMIGAITKGSGVNITLHCPSVSKKLCLDQRSLPNGMTCEAANLDGWCGTTLTGGASNTKERQLYAQEHCCVTCTKEAKKENGAECFDGIDNDGDGLLDCKDPDCLVDRGFPVKQANKPVEIRKCSDEMAKKYCDVKVVPGTTLGLIARRNCPQACKSAHAGHGGVLRRRGAVPRLQRRH